jgi:hypothetical protein
MRRSQPAESRKIRDSRERLRYVVALHHKFFLNW